MKEAIFLVVVLTVAVLASESPYLGKIKLAATGKTVQLRPLSEQPRIANIKGNAIELVLISEKDSCSVLPKFQRQTGEPPVLAVIDFTRTPPLTCRIAVKNTMIKQAGGQGLLLVTDNDQFAKNHCTKFDDNRFFTAVLDSSNYALLTAVKEKQIIGTLSIELKDSNMRLVEVWVSSLNAESYEMQLALGKAVRNLPSLEKRVEWHPRIATLGCTHGDNPNICSQDDFVSSCACKGEFCSPETHEKTAAVLVKEDLRQLLLFKQYPTRYLDYLRLFQTNCLQSYQRTKYAEDCSASVMDTLDIDSYSIATAVDSFLERCEEAPAQSDLYSSLDKDRKAFANYGRFPLLLLNKEIMDYKSQTDLEGQLCRKLELTDEGCFEVSESKTITTTVTGVLFYVLLVGVLLAVGAAVVICYRQRLKREMNKEIKMQVSTAVEHYYALTETPSRK